MKRLVTILFFILASLAFAKGNQVVGKFDIDSAQCDGDNFLWKKHDQIILSQKVLAFEGIQREEDDELCRFQDVYRLNEESKTVYTSSQRNILCWKLEEGEKSSKAKVDVESTPPKSLSIKTESRARGAKLTIEGTSLCPGILTMDLSFHLP